MNRNRKTRGILICVLVVAGVLLVTGRNVNADFVFGEPENLGPTVNSAYKESEFNMSFDGLELYFGSDRPGGRGGSDIWVSIRATTDDDWGTTVNLGLTVNSVKDDWAPNISADKLSLYFSSDRPGSLGDCDIWVTTRESISDPWGAPVNLGPTVNSSSGWQARPSISADGLSLFFGSNREKIGTPYSELCYIYVTTRPTTNDPWGAPVRLGPMVNHGLEYDSDWPSISEHGMSLFFSCWSSDGAALWVGTRTSVSDSWSRSVSLGLFGVCPCFSPDVSIMYFCSRKYGGYGELDLLKVSIEPIVDLNADGIVDAEDMCIMVDHWGTDEPLCDIGPMPWGDGIIDVQDLIVLAEHLFEETTPVE